MSDSITTWKAFGQKHLLQFTYVESQQTEPRKKKQSNQQI